ncbi:uncharacterized protein B0T23DRAFT_394155 [Neurospora hispaniola]|uniref:Uncharacterized protein n=1 Tax=Neurospora hispaniola TaxID=588809 RepID=A0AAJ0MUD5_9PEZI|nr:hypothetical protein B0T23DRAFT_394155 [Neurospora hispaniola]
MSMYWKADNGEINCATWALNADADFDTDADIDTNWGDERYQDDPAADSGNEKRDDDMDETVVNREKAVRAVRWMESKYPDQLALIREQVSTGWIQGGSELSSGQVLTKEVTREEQQECRELVRRDVDEVNRRAWQMQQAQQYASYHHQYPNHYQAQYHPDQYQLETGHHPYQSTLPSSSSGYYLPLPAPNTTLYLTAPDDHDGHDGHAEDADASGVAGLLIAPLSADEAPRSKSSTSTSRSKDASKHGKTEKKRERDKENKGKGGGKDKGQRR